MQHQTVLNDGCVTSVPDYAQPHLCVNDALEIDFDVQNFTLYNVCHCDAVFFQAGRQIVVLY